MKFVNEIKDLFIYVKYRYNENSTASIIWLINLMPNLVGFPITKDEPVRSK